MDVRDLLGHREGAGGSAKHLLRALFDERIVVLKGYTNVNSIRQFEREIAALKLLQHENIIVATGVTKIHTAEAIIYYLELEYCSGGSMLSWIAETNPPRAAIIRMLRGVLRALSHVHSVRVGQIVATHSDVKPSNILVRVQRVMFSSLRSLFSNPRL